MARTGAEKGEIKTFIRKNFNYDLNKPLSDIRLGYKFDSSCKGSVPQAIQAFLEAENYEDTIEKPFPLVETAILLQR
jgi:ADP-ribosylglycohydrolase